MPMPQGYTDAHTVGLSHGWDHANYAATYDAPHDYGVSRSA